MHVRNVQVLARYSSFSSHLLPAGSSWAVHQHPSYFPRSCRCMTNTKRLGAALPSARTVTCTRPRGPGSAPSTAQAAAPTKALKWCPAFPMKWSKWYRSALKPKKRERSICPASQANSYRTCRPWYRRGAWQSASAPHCRRTASSAVKSGRGTTSGGAQFCGLRSNSGEGVGRAPRGEREGRPVGGGRGRTPVVGGGGCVGGSRGLPPGTGPPGGGRRRGAPAPPPHGAALPLPPGRPPDPLPRVRAQPAELRPPRGRPPAGLDGRGGRAPAVRRAGRLPRAPAVPRPAGPVRVRLRRGADGALALLRLQRRPVPLRPLHGEGRAPLQGFGEGGRLGGRGRGARAPRAGARDGARRGEGGAEPLRVRHAAARPGEVRGVLVHGPAAAGREQVARKRRVAC